MLQLLAVFGISRALVYLLTDIGFDATAFATSCQFLDPNLLKDNLLESVWYLHGQPPLFNLFTGVMFKLFPGNYLAVIQGIFLLMGAAQVVMLYRIACRVTTHPHVQVGIHLLFMLLPATIVYENLFFYTYPVSFLLILAAYWLMVYLERGRWGYLLGFFSALAATILTRAMFHPVWLAAVLAFLLWMLPKARRTVLAAAAGPLVLVLGWFLKNWILFGMFGSSSWLGLNVSRVVLPQEAGQRHAYYNRGALSEFAYCSVRELRDLGENLVEVGAADDTVGWGGIPSLTQVYKANGDDNWNHIGMIAFSNRMYDESMAFLQRHPEVFLDQLRMATTTFFQPSGQYWGTVDSYRKLGWYTVFAGQDILMLSELTIGGLPVGAAFMQSIPLMLAYLVLFGCVGVFLLSKRMRPLIPPHLRILFGFLLLTILWTMAVGCSLEYGENMRFRYQITAFFIVASVTVLPIVYAVWARIRGREVAVPVLVRAEGGSMRKN